MKYWISIGGDIKGPYKPQELLGAPFFHPGMLVCPESSLGESGEDWRCADAVEDISFLMKGGAAPADRELAGEPLQPETEIDEESLPEAPDNSGPSGEEDIKRYLAGLGISSGSIPSVSEEEADSCARASVSDTEIEELEEEADGLKAASPSARARRPVPEPSRGADIPVTELKLPRSLGQLEPAWLASLEMNEVIQTLSASSENFTTRNDEEETTLALSELDFPVRRRLSPEYDEYAEETRSRSARRRRPRRMARYEEDYDDAGTRPLESWEEAPRQYAYPEDETFQQPEAAVQPFPAQEAPAAQQPVEEQLVAEQPAQPAAEEIPSQEAAPADETAPVQEPVAETPVQEEPKAAETPEAAKPEEAASAPSAEAQPAPQAAEPAGASTESAVSSRLNISDTEVGELSGIGKVVLPGGDTSGRASPLPETSGINLGKLPDANISMRGNAMSTQSGRLPQKQQPAAQQQAKPVQTQRFAAPAQAAQPGFGLPPVQSVPQRVNTFSQPGPQQRTVSKGPNISQRSQVSGLNIADTQSVRLSFPGGGAPATMQPQQQATSPHNTTANSKETAVVAGHIRAAQPTIAAEPAKPRKKGLKPVVLFGFLGIFVIVAAVGIMILLKAVQKDESKEAAQQTADVSAGKGDAKSGQSPQGAASPFPQQGPKPVITPQTPEQQSGAQTPAASPAAQQPAPSETSASPSRPGGQMSAVMVKAIDIVKQHDLGGGKGTIEQWFQNSFQSAENVGVQANWKAQLLNGDSYMVTYTNMRPRSEPLVYQFEVDVTKGVILRGVNNEARALFAESQPDDSSATIRRPKGAASRPVKKQQAAAVDAGADDAKPVTVKPARKPRRKAAVVEDVNDQLPLPEESPSDELE